MNIEDIINVTDGLLQNQPSVTSIDAATTFSSKVERGDLFFSNDEHDIKKAVEHGAYAIVYEGEIEHTDSEIAWIKVESVELAAFKFLRYISLKKESQFILLKAYEESFLKMILTHKNAVSFIPNDWRKAFEVILNGEGSLFAGSNEKLIEMLRPDIPKLKESIDGYVITDSLFKSTFKVDGYVYQLKELAPFHLEHLLKVMTFCQKNDLEYNLDKLKYTKHYQPVFIDKNLYVTAKSKTDRVIVFVDNIEDILLAREYIKYSNKWVKSIIYTPPKTKIDGVDRCEWYESEDHLREMLKETHFNYAFVYKASKELLQGLKKDYSLF